MRLSFIQDLFQLTGKLQDNIGNNTNVALKEALEAMATEVMDLHTDLCTIRQSREKRQLVAAVATGSVTAIITLIAVSGRFLNYLNPHGDSLPSRGSRTNAYLN